MRRLIVLIAFVLTFSVPSVYVRAEPSAAGKTALDVVPYHYGRVVSEELLIYENPGDATPVRSYTSAGTWVSIRGHQTVDGEVWYQVDRGGWTPASAVAVGQLSEFRGVQIRSETPVPFGFVVADPLNVRALPGVSDENPPIGELQRYTVLSILEETDVEGTTWHRIGEDRWVSGLYVRRVAPVVRPEKIGPGERWIEVNLQKQTLVAYEGDRMVYATLISSGLPRWQTVTGLFRVWIKIKHRKMSGGSFEQGDYYYLADVPWTMYFKGGYAVHAAYWHNDFGRPKSHGCVNLSPLDSYWLFQWATPDLASDDQALRSSSEDPGTWVFVHAGTQPEASDAYSVEQPALSIDVLTGSAFTSIGWSW